MDKNEQKKNHDIEKETVGFSFPLSDLLYTQGFRKRLEAARKKLEADPKAELTSSGILIVSDELSDGKYAIKSTSFGSINNTINTLAQVLIDKLIKATPPEKEAREQVLENFMDYFISEATARFFDDVENDEGTE